MERNRNRWRVRLQHVIAAFVGLLTGMIMLFACEWGHTYMKALTNASDVVLCSDAFSVFIALAATCTVIAILGRLSGLPWYWTSVGIPLALSGFLLGYGVSHGVLNESWEALQSTQAVAFGDCRFPAILLLVASIVGAGIGTLGVSPWSEMGKKILPSRVLLGSIFFVLLIIMEYGQMKGELDQIVQLSQRFSNTKADMHNERSYSDRANSYILTPSPQPRDKKTSR